MKRNKFWHRGEHWVWFTGLALSMILGSALILFMVVVKNGAGAFWPYSLQLWHLKDQTSCLGQLVHVDKDSIQGRRYQIKVANRDLYGMDFRWIADKDIAATEQPAHAVILERKEYGNFFGFLENTNGNTDISASEEEKWKQFVLDLKSIKKDVLIRAKIEDQISEINNQIEKIHFKKIKIRQQSENKQISLLENKETQLKNHFNEQMKNLEQISQTLLSKKALFKDVQGQIKEIPLANIVWFFQPNQMTWLDKSIYYIKKIGELLWDNPREANTEGGLFPAIFGTIMLVLLMSLVSFPFGVITGVYLSEYSKDTLIVRLIRIAVNNLAGIPSIVFGVFGLGFFVYIIGGTIDQWFFSERLPTPTFGTGGILWASATLALLTMPVVIISTEEALRSIPAGIREAALALGSTKIQIIARLLLPLATPGIMTGFILSMARAAGEVAPLMITGVVKLAPTLPLNTEFPFLHLDRKFMHLGFHIYDVGFQSPNVEAAKPMVFITTLLLVFIVVVMSGFAIYLRNKMKERYTIKSL